MNFLFDLMFCLLTLRTLDFTGIDSPYEIPENPDDVLHTSQKSVAECSQQLVDLLVKQVAS